MSLQNLALYFYNTSTGVSAEYGSIVEDLSFTTIAPGGCGDLTATLRFEHADLPRPELALFSRVAVMDGPTPVWIGRIDEPAMALDQAGTFIGVHAQGGASNLKDDPQDFPYTPATGTWTAQNIVKDQLNSSVAKRNKTIQLDSDTSQILPNNPAGTFTMPENGADFEQVLQDVISSIGDYTWEVWPHPVHRDTMGFPTWQLFMHTRDTSTIGYTAYLTDMEDNGYEVRPAIEVCFNVVTVLYRNSADGTPASVTVQDSRLNANGSQGTAPFPWRRYRLDKSSDLLSTTQATNIANTILNMYKNPGSGYKATFNLDSVRDANGSSIPLWQVRADANLFAPELNKSLGQQLATTATAGQNLFYIKETEYRESSGSVPTLSLTCGENKDVSQFTARGLNEVVKKQRTDNKLYTATQAAASSDTGYCGGSWYFPGAGTYAAYFAVAYHSQMSTVPTSITYSWTDTGNVTAGPSSSFIDVGGAVSFVTATAGVLAIWVGTFTTNGN